jgi:wyosine [tRNA(Phe)-imidazoG37] synthetase (radical SAM superfamily)
MNHVFGPVPSRRLGRSLGVDLVPFKTCSYDCIYCQLGHTTNKITQRARWVNWDTVLEELRKKLSSQPDYITLSGSGEPTLHAGLDELIEAIKAITRVPVAVLTNGSLLWQTDLRRELQGADLVIPSLDAGDDMRFRYINRPHESIIFQRMIDGLVAFGEEFRGQYWMEVFLLAGYTGIDAEVTSQIKSWSNRLPNAARSTTGPYDRPTTSQADHSPWPSKPPISRPNPSRPSTFGRSPPTAAPRV